MLQLKSVLSILIIPGGEPGCPLFTPPYPLHFEVGVAMPRPSPATDMYLTLKGRSHMATN
ncbi:hypothetical protein J6590_061025 [Homalodisca vitripennis]|nr:hypothetical protein J6590_061025 [Homalodisca vitripennis]